MSDEPDEIRALTRELDPQAILAAYRVGLFPMGLGERGAPPYGWWSPEVRGMLLPGALRVSRSLRRSLRGFTWSTDTAFDAVLRACADPEREGAWIDAGIMDAYRSLHAQGHAHSVEIWDGDGLAGGLYGIGIGSFFAGESMFHHRTDASKAALVALTEIMSREFGNIWLIDTQWSTPHLASLGVSELDRWDWIPRLGAGHRARRLLGSSHVAHTADEFLRRVALVCTKTTSDHEDAAPHRRRKAAGRHLIGPS